MMNEINGTVCYEYVIKSFIKEFVINNCIKDKL